MRISFKQYFNSEIEKFKNFSLLDILIPLSLWAIWIISFFNFHIFFMHFIRLYFLPENLNLSENIGRFYFFNSNISHLIIFYLINGIFYLIYTFDLIPKKYKIQPNWPWEENKDEFDEDEKKAINVINDPQKYNEKESNWKTLRRQTIKTIFINHMILVPLFTLPNLLLNNCSYKVTEAEFEKDIWDYLNYAYLVRELLPSFLICVLCEDFCFYWGHSFLHTDFLYKHVHKVHHSYKSTVSWSSEVAHPVEYLLGNIVPTVSGLLILGKRISPATATFFLFTRVFKTCEAHSGYSFPYSMFKFFPCTSNAEMHNYHHYKFKGNYGSFFTYWDFIMGTFNRPYVNKYMVKRREVETDEGDKKIQ